MLSNKTKGMIIEILKKPYYFSDLEDFSDFSLSICGKIPAGNSLPQKIRELILNLSDDEEINFLKSITRKMRDIDDLAIPITQEKIFKDFTNIRGRVKIDMNVNLDENGNLEPHINHNTENSLKESIMVTNAQGEVQLPSTLNTDNSQINRSIIEKKELEQILESLKKFNRKYKEGQENAFRNDLFTFLEGAGYDVKQNYDVEGGGHIDILINYEISMQLKIVNNKTLFDFITGQAINDIGRFKISMAVIFDISQDRRFFKKFHLVEKNRILYFVYY